MEITTLLVVTTLVSLIVQALKWKFGGGAWTQFILILISLAGGGAYLFFQTHAEYWKTVSEIILGANAIYTFIIQYFEK